MHTYLVRRNGIAAGATALSAALTRLRSLEDQPHALPVRWLHSYALREADGRFGLACVFEADDPEALHEHAERVELPVTDILRVVATRVQRTFAPTLVHLVRRRGFCRTDAELAQADQIARRIGDEQMARQVSWLRSYAVREHDGTLGSVCLYQGVDADALRQHASRAGLPADEVVPVIGRIVFRDEPVAPSTLSPRALPA